MHSQKNRDNRKKDNRIEKHLFWSRLNMFIMCVSLNQIRKNERCVRRLYLKSIDSFLFIPRWSDSESCSQCGSGAASLAFPMPLSVGSRLLRNCPRRLFLPSCYKWADVCRIWLRRKSHDCCFWYEAGHRPFKKCSFNYKMFENKVKSSFFSKKNKAISNNCLSFQFRSFSRNLSPTSGQACNIRTLHYSCTFRSTTKFSQ